MKALLDTNVILDIIFRRLPWKEKAVKIWQAHEKGLIQAHMSASAMTDVFYVTRREAGLEAAQRAVGKLLSSLTIITVDRAILAYANQLPGKDFEDNVQIACAIKAEVGAIITRDKADFRLAAVPVFTPAEFVAELNL
jgi:predicted nucleic acid-binding protein